jgi:type IV pilus assembly protein PilM
MAFEISEAGIAAARIGSRAELDFQALKPGTLAVSPIKENVLDADAFIGAVRSLAGTQGARKRKDVALILPDFAARIAVLDFDVFPKDPKEQASLIRFRLKRSVPFDVETAVLSYMAQPSHSSGKTDVVAVIVPLEIVSRYEAPFRKAGMNPGLITTSGLAALDLAPEAGLSVIAKITGRVLTVLVREQASLKLVRCLELPSATLDDIVGVLIPTFVYIEDNLGRPAEKLFLCGFEEDTQEAARELAAELKVDVEPLRSQLGAPGENNAGLLGYLRSIAKN